MKAERAGSGGGPERGGTNPGLAPRVRTIGIVGAGRVGRALGALLGRRHEIWIASPRSAARAAAFIGGGARPAAVGELAERCSHVIVAVPDAAIGAAAAELSGGRVATALHTCGSLGPSALAPLPQQGVSCATFHPLQTFASPARAVERLPGCAFGICGTGAALAWALELCAELSGAPLVVAEENLALYHAAAVVAGNYAVGLVDVAVMLMEQAGMERESALQALAPLVLASAENALTMGPEAALTGPIERGDIPTVESHLESLRAAPAGADAVYRALGRQLAAIARRRGLPAEQAARIEALLLPRTDS